MTSNSERTHVLAFAENRNVSDCAPAASQHATPLEDAQPNEIGSLLLRRSMDSGETWGDLQTVEFSPGLNIDFLAGVTDTVTNTVWLMLQKKGGGVQVFTSADEGATWAQPKELTKDWDIKSWSPDIEPSTLKPGCAHGVQIQHGMCSDGCNEAGRLVIPFVCLNSSATGSHSDKGCATCLACNLISDDHGKTWTLGGAGQRGTRESQVTQISSTGTHAALYINERNMGAKPGFRMTAISTDGGSTYGSFATDTTLVSPVTPHWTGIVAGVSRLSASSLAYLSPVNPSSRSHLGMRISEDEGKTWSDAKTVWEGPAGYSDLAWVGNSSVVAIYENGDTEFAERVSVSVVSRSWFNGV